MAYNIEEQEDYLKSHSPYSIHEEQWEAMQQRLKSRVLAEREQQMPLRRKRPFLRPAIGIAAGIALLVSVYVAQERRQQPAGTPALLQLSAEQQLDKAISGLSDAELSYIHQLNEEDLEEAGEAFENELL